MNTLTAVSLLLTLGAGYSAVVQPVYSGDKFELLILHNNDMHAKFEQTSQRSGACTVQDREAGKCYGGFPRVAHVVKEARRKAQTGEGPPVLYLNAGDTYTGTAWFTIYKWRIAAEFINALQPDAVSLGNHEFDDGVSGLTPFIENITTPVLCSNIILTKVPELAREENLKKSIVLNVDGVKIGIVGYLTPETKVVAVANDVEYIEEIDAMRVEVKKLQDQGVKIIIGLGHSGYSKDIEIAKNVEGLDLVIGGHTNTFLWNGTSPDYETPQGPYPTYVAQPSGRTVLVVQAYAYTKYLGRLHLKFDSDGEIISADGMPILLDHTVPQDLDVLKLLDKYRENILAQTEDVVGETRVILDDKCSVEECNLGNLITDAMVYRYATSYKGEHWTDAPIAIMQAGGIRTAVAHSSYPTNITIADLLGVMPFEGNMTVVTMNGTILIAMLEHAVAKFITADVADGFLQFSGLNVIYDLNKDVGSRVVNAEARCWACDVPQFFKVDKKEIYKVLMSGFLAQGGDGYSMFKDLETQELGFSELDSTKYYVSQKSPIYPQIEGRITLLEYKDKDSSSSIVQNKVLTILTSVLSLGNHEFDENIDGLIPFIRNVSTPVLASNLILNKVPELAREENLKRSIVITVEGKKIAIIGYLTAETKFLAPKNKVEYIDEVDAIQAEVNKYKQEGVNIFIALGHSGFVKDLEIARKVIGLDLVIGGHSNTFLWNGETKEIPEIPVGHYPYEVKQASGKVVRVVQAYAYTKYMGLLRSSFNERGDIIECSGEPILLDYTVPQDAEVEKIVEKYKYKIDLVNNVVVGTSMVTLQREYCRVRECNIGSLITDAVLNYTQSENESYQANIVFVQGGRIRTSLDRPEKPFNMTRGDWLNVIPFDDPLTLVSVDGKTLKEALEHSVSNWRLIDSPGSFLQVSGMEVVYDLANPKGSRVVIARAMCSKCKTLEPVKDDDQYKILMSSFLADGGDGFAMFEGLDKEILNYNEIDCIINYLSKTGPVAQTEMGRITVKNENVITNDFLRSSQMVVLPSSLLSCIALLFLQYFI